MTTYTNTDILNQQAVIAANQLSYTEAQSSAQAALATLQASRNHLAVINNTIALATAEAAAAAAQNQS